jgi:hypothetical protein
VFAYNNTASEGGDDDADMAEEEEDEEFPAAFSPPPAWDEQEETFNAEASGKALNAFLDDGSNSEEDEPLPVAGVGSIKNEEQEEHDEPFPPPPAQQPGREEEGHITTRAAGTIAEPIEIDDGGDTPEQDEPLPSQVPHEQVGNLSLMPEQQIQTTHYDGGAVISPHGPYPSSPPPPPPPLSPPPPPPPLSPPPNEGDDQHRPSSPTIIIPQSPRIPPPPAPDSPKEVKDWGLIDYSRYHPYVSMAQRINGCLEKLAEVR